MYANKYFPHYAISGLFVSYDKSGNKQHFDNEQGAKDHASSGEFVEYKGFQISGSSFAIFKKGKAVFTAPWQDCDTLEKAKQMIDNSIAAKIELTPFEEWQVDRYENIEPENGNEESERFAAWSREQHEHQIYEQSNY